MPVELRKRKAPAAPAPAPAPKKANKTATTTSSKAAGGAKKAASAAKKDVDNDAKSKSASKPKAAAAAPAKPAAAKDGQVAVGDVIDLEGFGGEIETNDGETTTLKKLVDESEAGVVLFTYPKASTPGCTNQVCLFRDSYEPLTAGGLAIYGLSADSPKANTTFKTKQRLPYALLCDPSRGLIGAIGLKKTAASGTQRGVFAVDKVGKVLVAEPGGPAATVERVKALVGELKK